MPFCFVGWMSYVTVHADTNWLHAAVVGWMSYVICRHSLVTCNCGGLDELCYMPALSWLKVAVVGWMSYVICRHSLGYMQLWWAG